MFTQVFLAKCDTKVRQVWIFSKVPISVEGDGRLNSPRPTHTFITRAVEGKRESVFAATTLPSIMVFGKSGDAPEPVVPEVVFRWGRGGGGKQVRSARDREGRRSGTKKK